MLKIYLVLSLFFFSVASDATVFSTSAFTLALPEGMQETLKHEEPNQNVLQYVYQTTGDMNTSGMQIRITQLLKTPAKESEHEQFQTEALGAMIAIYTQTHKLSLKDQKEVLSKTPRSIKIGSQSYKSVTMHFPNRDVEFLITLVKSSTYMFYLIAVDKEETKRKAYLDSMRTQLDTIKFK